MERKIDEEAPPAPPPASLNRLPIIVRRGGKKESLGVGSNWAKGSEPKRCRRFVAENLDPRPNCSFPQSQITTVQLG